MSGEAIDLPGFEQFVGILRARLEVGAREYGDTSFERHTEAIIGEVEQELLDVVGWSYILWCRMHKLRQRFSNPPPTPSA